MTVEVKARATDSDDLLSLTADTLLIPDDENGTERAGILRVRDSDSTYSAFGDLSTAEITAIFQSDFSYNINAALWNTLDNNGTTTTDTYRAKLSTGAAANQSAILESRVPIKYNPGQGGLVRFTTVYTTGVAGSTQCHGIGSTSDGYFFSYSGDTFGVMRRYGGSTEFQTLTITTASSTIESVTVTLNGVAASVPVTDSGVISTTANEIAAFDFSDTGTGWSATAHGDEVHFISFAAEVMAGAFTVAGTSIVGAFVQTIAGVAPTEDFIAQSAWNKDVMDGSGLSGMTLDQTMGNVYQIRYQWLGYGSIFFYIEDTDTGRFTLVHQIKYAGTSTVPSVNNPSLPLHMEARNVANTSDIVMYSASMAGFVEGSQDGAHSHIGTSVTAAYTSAAETPIITIRNKHHFQGVTNRSSTNIIIASVATDGTKSAILRFKAGATLTGAAFTDVSTAISPMSVDTSATAVSGGQEQFAVALAKVDSEVIDVAAVSFSLEAGDYLTLTCQSASNTIVTVSFNWEDFG